MRRVGTGIGTKLRLVDCAPRAPIRRAVGERIRVEDKAALDETRDRRAGVMINENIVGASKGVSDGLPTALALAINRPSSAPLRDTKLSDQ